MKKLLTLTLTLILVLGIGSITLAQPVEAELDVHLLIADYFEMAIVTEYFDGSAGNSPLIGLFNEDGGLLGQAGYYVSDGNATRNRAQTLFSRGDQPVNTPDRDGVEMVVVAANTDTVLDMEVDWGADWDPAYLRAFFRFSSAENIGDTFDDRGIAVFGNFASGMAVGHYNTVMAAAHPGFNNELVERGNISWETFQQMASAEGLAGYDWGDHMGFVSNFDTPEGLSVKDSIDIPYRNCTPSLIHINGAVEIHKTTGLQAGLTDAATIKLTLAAAP